MKNAPNPPSLEALLAVLHQRFEKPNPEFVTLLRLLYSSDDQESDTGFDRLMRRAGEFFEELVTVFQPVAAELSEREPESWNWYYHALMDCIASAHHPKLLSILWRELRNQHPRARAITIGILGAEGKNNPEARKILQNAKKYEFATPEETWEFRKLIDKALHGE